MTNTVTPPMPMPEANGFIKTLNNMGYMTSSLDPISEAFANYAATTARPALDIGAAYGIATLEALKRGPTMYANDIDSRHLEVIRERARRSTLASPPLSGRISRIVRTP